MGKVQEPYANDPLLFYPGHRLSDEDRSKMDQLQIPLDRLSIDHVIYSMGRQISANFQIFYQVAEDVVGEDAASEIAEEIGRRYGAKGYEQFLENLGSPGAGSPRTMAMYQDLVHAIRGPAHGVSLFAEYDEQECVVQRPHCIYVDVDNPDTWQYTGAFEGGCLEAYAKADANLERVDNPVCRFRGDERCEHRFHFKSAPVDQDEA